MKNSGEVLVSDGNGSTEPDTSGTIDLTGSAADNAQPKSPAPQAAHSSGAISASATKKKKSKKSKRRILRRHPPPFTLDVKIRAVDQLKMMGVSARKISQELGVPRSELNFWIDAETALRAEYAEYMAILAEEEAAAKAAAAKSPTKSPRKPVDDVSPSNGAATLASTQSTSSSTGSSASTSAGGKKASDDVAKQDVDAKDEVATATSSSSSSSSNPPSTRKSTAPVQTAATVESSTSSSGSTSIKSTSTSTSSTSNAVDTHQSSAESNPSTTSSYSSAQANTAGGSGAEAATRQGGREPPSPRPARERYPLEMRRKVVEWHRAKRHLRRPPSVDDVARKFDVESGALVSEWLRQAEEEAGEEAEKREAEAEESESLLRARSGGEVVDTKVDSDSSPTAAALDAASKTELLSSATESVALSEAESKLVPVSATAPAAEGDEARLSKCTPAAAEEENEVVNLDSDAFDDTVDLTNVVSDSEHLHRSKPARTVSGHAFASSSSSSSSSSRSRSACRTRAVDNTAGDARTKPSKSKALDSNQNPDAHVPHFEPDGSSVPSSSVEPNEESRERSLSSNSSCSLSYPKGAGGRLVMSVKPVYDPDATESEIDALNDAFHALRAEAARIGGRTQASPPDALRLHVLDYLHAHSGNVSATAKRFRMKYASVWSFKNMEKRLRAAVDELAKQRPDGRSKVSPSGSTVPDTKTKGEQCDQVLSSSFAHGGSPTGSVGRARGTARKTSRNRISSPGHATSAGAAEKRRVKSTPSEAAEEPHSNSKKIEATLSKAADKPMPSSSSKSDARREEVSPREKNPEVSPREKNPEVPSREKTPEVSSREKKPEVYSRERKLEVLDWWHAHGNHARQAADKFGIRGGVISEWIFDEANLRAPHAVESDIDSDCSNVALSESDSDLGSSPRKARDLTVDFDSDSDSYSDSALHSDSSDADSDVDSDSDADADSDSESSFDSGDDAAAQSNSESDFEEESGDSDTTEDDDAEGGSRVLDGVSSRVVRRSLNESLNASVSRGSKMATRRRGRKRSKILPKSSKISTRRSASSRKPKAKKAAQTKANATAKAPKGRRRSGRKAAAAAKAKAKSDLELAQELSERENTRRSRRPRRQTDFYRAPSPSRSRSGSRSHSRSRSPGGEASGGEVVKREKRKKGKGVVKHEQDDTSASAAVDVEEALPVRKSPRDRKPTDFLRMSASSPPPSATPEEDDKNVEEEDVTGKYAPASRAGAKREQTPNSSSSTSKKAVQSVTAPASSDNSTKHSPTEESVRKSGRRKKQTAFFQASTLLASPFGSPSGSPERELVDLARVPSRRSSVSKSAESQKKSAAAPRSSVKQEASAPTPLRRSSRPRGRSKSVSRPSTPTNEDAVKAEVNRTKSKSAKSSNKKTIETDDQASMSDEDDLRVPPWHTLLKLKKRKPAKQSKTGGGGGGPAKPPPKSKADRSRERDRERHRRVRGQVWKLTWSVPANVAFAVELEAKAEAARAKANADTAAAESNVSSPGNVSADAKASSHGGLSAAEGRWAYTAVAAARMSFKNGVKYDRIKLTRVRVPSNPPRTSGVSQNSVPSTLPQSSVVLSPGGQSRTTPRANDVVKSESLRSRRLRKRARSIDVERDVVSSSSSASSSPRGRPEASDATLHDHMSLNLNKKARVDSSESSDSGAQPKGTTHPPMPLTISLPDDNGVSMRLTRASLQRQRSDTSITSSAPGTPRRSPRSRRGSVQTPTPAINSPRSRRGSVQTPTPAINSPRSRRGSVQTPTPAAIKSEDAPGTISSNSGGRTPVAPGRSSRSRRGSGQAPGASEAPPELLPSTRRASRHQRRSASLASSASNSPRTTRQSSREKKAAAEAAGREEILRVATAIAPFAPMRPPPPGALRRRRSDESIASSAPGTPTPAVSASASALPTNHTPTPAASASPTNHTPTPAGSASPTNRGSGGGVSVRTTRGALKRKLSDASQVGSPLASPRGSSQIPGALRRSMRVDSKRQRSRSSSRPHAAQRSASLTSSPTVTNSPTPGAETARDPSSSNAAGGRGVAVRAPSKRRQQPERRQEPGRRQQSERLQRSPSAIVPTPPAAAAEGSGGSPISSPVPKQGSAVASSSPLKTPNGNRTFNLKQKIEFIKLYRSKSWSPKEWESQHAVKYYTVKWWHGTKQSTKLEADWREVCNISPRLDAIDWCREQHNLSKEGRKRAAAKFGVSAKEFNAWISAEDEMRKTYSRKFHPRVIRKHTLSAKIEVLDYVRDHPDVTISDAFRKFDIPGSTGEKWKQKEKSIRDQFAAQSEQIDMSDLSDHPDGSDVAASPEKRGTPPRSVIKRENSSASRDKASPEESESRPTPPVSPTARISSRSGVRNTSDKPSKRGKVTPNTKSTAKEVEVSESTPPTTNVAASVSSTRSDGAPPGFATDSRQTPPLPTTTSSSSRRSLRSASDTPSGTSPDSDHTEPHQPSQSRKVIPSTKSAEKEINVSESTLPTANVAASPASTQSDDTFTVSASSLSRPAPREFSVNYKVSVLDFFHKNDVDKHAVCKKFEVSRRSINRWLRDEREYRKLLASGVDSSKLPSPPRGPKAGACVSDPPKSPSSPSARKESPNSDNGSTEACSSEVARQPLIMQHTSPTKPGAPKGKTLYSPVFKIRVLNFMRENPGIYPSAVGRHFSIAESTVRRFKLQEKKLRRDHESALAAETGSSSSSASSSAGAHLAGAASAVPTACARTSPKRRRSETFADADASHSTATAGANKRLKADNVSSPGASAESVAPPRSSASDMARRPAAIEVPPHLLRRSKRRRTSLPGGAAAATIAGEPDRAIDLVSPTKSKVRRIGDGTAASPLSSSKLAASDTVSSTVGPPEAHKPQPPAAPASSLPQVTSSTATKALPSVSQLASKPASVSVDISVGVSTSVGVSPCVSEKDLSKALSSASQPAVPKPASASVGVSVGVSASVSDKDISTALSSFSQPAAPKPVGVGVGASVSEKDILWLTASTASARQLRHGGVGGGVVRLVRSSSRSSEPQRRGGAVAYSTRGASQRRRRLHNAFPDELIVLDDSDEEEDAAQKAAEHAQSANANKKVIRWVRAPSSLKKKSEPSAQAVAITHALEIGSPPSCEMTLATKLSGLREQTILTRAASTTVPPSGNAPPPPPLPRCLPPSSISSIDVYKCTAAACGAKCATGGASLVLCTTLPQSVSATTATSSQTSSVATYVAEASASVSQAGSVTKPSATVAEEALGASAGAPKPRRKLTAKKRVAAAVATKKAAADVAMTTAACFVALRDVIAIKFLASDETCSAASEELDESFSKPAPACVELQLRVTKGNLSQVAEYLGKLGIAISPSSAVGSVVTMRFSFEGKDTSSQMEDEDGDGEAPCAGDCSPTLCAFLFNDERKLLSTGDEDSSHKNGDGSVGCDFRGFASEWATIPQLSSVLAFERISRRHSQVEDPEALTRCLNETPDYVTSKKRSNRKKGYMPLDGALVSGGALSANLPLLSRLLKHVTTHEVESTRGEEYLVGIIIDLYLSYLASLDQFKEVARSCRIFRCLWYQADKSWLCAPDASVPGQPSLFDRDYLIIPINYGKHWHVIISCFARNATRPQSDWAKPTHHPCLVDMNSLVSRNSNSRKLAPIAATVRALLNKAWAAEFPTPPPEEARDEDDMFDGADSDDSDSEFAVFTRQSLPAFSIEVPQQSNWCDCGFFMTKNIEWFFQAPFEDTRSKAHFPKFAFAAGHDIHAQRREIRRVLCSLRVDQLNALVVNERRKRAQLAESDDGGRKERDSPVAVSDGSSSPSDGASVSAAGVKESSAPPVTSSSDRGSSHSEGTSASASASVTAANESSVPLMSSSDGSGASNDTSAASESVVSPVASLVSGSTAKMSSVPPPPVPSNNRSGASERPSAPSASVAPPVSGASLPSGSTATAAPPSSARGRNSKSIASAKSSCSKEAPAAQSAKKSTSSTTAHSAKAVAASTKGAVAKASANTAGDRNVETSATLPSESNAKAAASRRGGHSAKVNTKANAISPSDRSAKSSASPSIDRSATSSDGTPSTRAASTSTFSERSAKSGATPPSDRSVKTSASPSIDSSAISSSSPSIDRSTTSSTGAPSGRAATSSTSSDRSAKSGATPPSDRSVKSSAKTVESQKSGKADVGTSPLGHQKTSKAQNAGDGKHPPKKSRRSARKRVQSVKPPSTPASPITGARELRSVDNIDSADGDRPRKSRKLEPRKSSQPPNVALEKSTTTAVTVKKRKSPAGGDATPENVSKAANRKTKQRKLGDKPQQGDVIMIDVNDDTKEVARTTSAATKASASTKPKPLISITLNPKLQAASSAKSKGLHAASSEAGSSLKLSSGGSTLAKKPPEKKVPGASEKRTATPSSSHAKASQSSKTQPKSSVSSPSAKRSKVVLVDLSGSSSPLRSSSSKDKPPSTTRSLSLLMPSSKAVSTAKTLTPITGAGGGKTVSTAKTLTPIPAAGGGTAVPTTKMFTPIPATAAGGKTVPASSSTSRVAAAAPLLSSTSLLLSSIAPSSVSSKSPSETPLSDRSDAGEVNELMATLFSENPRRTGTSTAHRSGSSNPPGVPEHRGAHSGGAYATARFPRRSRFGPPASPSPYPNDPPVFGQDHSVLSSGAQHPAPFSYDRNRRRRGSRESSPRLPSPTASAASVPFPHHLPHNEYGTPQSYSYDPTQHGRSAQVAVPQLPPPSASPPPTAASSGGPWVHTYQYNRDHASPHASLSQQPQAPTYVRQRTPPCDLAGNILGVAHSNIDPYAGQTASHFSRSQHSDNQHTSANPPAFSPSSVATTYALQSPPPVFGQPIQSHHDSMSPVQEGYTTDTHSQVVSSQRPRDPRTPTASSSPSAETPRQDVNAATYLTPARQDATEVYLATPRQDATIHATSSHQYASVHPMASTYQDDAAFSSADDASRSTPTVAVTPAVAVTPTPAPASETLRALHHVMGDVTAMLMSDGMSILRDSPRFRFAFPKTSTRTATTRR